MIETTTTTTYTCDVTGEIVSQLWRIQATNSRAYGPSDLCIIDVGDPSLVPVFVSWYVSMRYRRIGVNYIGEQKS